LEKWINGILPKRQKEVLRLCGKKTIDKLFDVLDILCKSSDRNIFVVLPEDPEKQIPYLKHEIQKCLDLL